MVLRAGFHGTVGQPSAQVIDGSLKFDGSKPTYLKRTFSAGNQRTWTWSAWVRRDVFGQRHNLFGAPNTDSNGHYIEFRSTDKFQLEDYAGSLDFTNLTRGLHSYPKEQLHLGVSVRSFRAERLSEFVHHLIGNDPDKAYSSYIHIKDKYPIYLTRDINTARNWLREKAQGSELYGLTASSGARRLRPEGIEVRRELEPDVWFLNGRDDVRSCQYLEQVATEFDIQGLELDWAVVCWDADLRRDEDMWQYRRFIGTKWQNVNKPVDQQYLLNAYRVLLTRARQGMIIYVPLGDEKDITRKPEFYQPIADFLASTGISRI